MFEPKVQKDKRGNLCIENRDCTAEGGCVKFVADKAECSLELIPATKLKPLHGREINRLAHACVVMEEKNEELESIEYVNHDTDKIYMTMVWKDGVTEDLTLNRKTMEEV